MRIRTALLLALLANLILTPSTAQPNTLGDLTPSADLNRTSVIATINKTPLTRSQKLTVIKAVRKVLRSLFVHKNIARNIHKADPFTELDKLANNPPSPNHRFHASIRRVLQRLNDFHTRYRLPPPVNTIAAVLPLSIRIFYTNPPERRYVLTEVFAPEVFITNPDFKVGAEVVSFDGLPIDLAVKKLGRSSYGANPAARISRAEHLLTARAISLEAIPDRDFAEIGFKTPDGAVEHVVAPWLYIELTDPGLLSLVTRQAIDWPHDPEANRAHLKFLNAPRTELPNLDFSSVHAPAGERMKIEVAEPFQALFSAEVIGTKSGSIGRLTLPSFGSRANEPLIAELSRILKLMPSNGLVIDLRGNLGGLPDYVKALTELFSDIPILPQPLFGRVSKLQEGLLQAVDGNITDPERIFIKMFRSAVRTGLIAGEEYTGPVGDLFSIGLETGFPRSERVYFGPVITLVDGRTYSSGDIFAALQVDQGHSLVVGVSDNTGAGGASTINYRDLARIAPKVFEPLPQSIGFSVALTRFHRTGERSGTMIEVFGVKPDIRYYPTYDDNVGNECDMFEFLGDKLASMRKM